MIRLVTHNQDNMYGIAGSNIVFDEVPDALKAADMIMTNSSIDRWLADMLKTFKEYSDESDLVNIDDIDRLKFEEKRSILCRLTRKYPEDKEMVCSTGCVSVLHHAGQRLDAFLVDIQELEPKRNRSAHDDIVFYLLRKEVYGEIKSNNPDLLENEEFCSMLYAVDKNEIQQFEERYEKYNEIIKKHSLLLTVLECGGADIIIKELLGLEGIK